jgi:hypothetical protein
VLASVLVPPVIDARDMNDVSGLPPNSDNVGGDCVEHAGDTVLRDAPPKEGIALEGAKSVVLDLCVCGRRALPDKVEVDVST